MIHNKSDVCSVDLDVHSKVDEAYKYLLMSCGKFSLYEIIKSQERIKGRAKKRKSRETSIVKDEVIMKKYLGEEQKFEHLMTLN